ncbi:MAG: 50S ribosomal protein L13 [Thaumarchaeota archaeon]|nr:50S ribosomal protein L13 [Nitrososphaerota archaeon]
MASTIQELKSEESVEEKRIQPTKYYIDASGQILGRMGSKVAKLLLNGNSVVVVHADKVLLSGSRASVMRDFFDRLKIASVVHPKHGPFHPRTPAGMLTRMIRGMIPRSKPSGIAALRRLRVYTEIPKELEKISFTNFEEAKATKPLAYYIPLGEVAQRIGWKGAPSEN